MQSTIQGILCDLIDRIASGGFENGQSDMEDEEGQTKKLEKMECFEPFHVPGLNPDLEVLSYQIEISGGHSHESSDEETYPESSNEEEDAQQEADFIFSQCEDFSPMPNVLGGRFQYQPPKLPLHCPEISSLGDLFEVEAARNGFENEMAETEKALTNFLDKIFPKDTATEENPLGLNTGGHHNFRHFQPQMFDEDDGSWDITGSACSDSDGTTEEEDIIMLPALATFHPTPGCSVMRLGHCSYLVKGSEKDTPGINERLRSTVTVTEIQDTLEEDQPQAVIKNPCAISTENISKVESDMTSDDHPWLKVTVSDQPVHLPSEESYPVLRNLFKCLFDFLKLFKGGRGSNTDVCE